MTDNSLESKVKQLMPQWSVDEYTYLKSMGYFNIEPKKRFTHYLITLDKRINALKNNTINT